VRGWPIRHMEFLGKYAFQFPRLKSWRSIGAYSIIQLKWSNKW
jgi:hypothetical protein